jgi:hypothetical protein
MNRSHFVTDEGSQFHYKVRVRPTTPPASPQCLWGSAGLLQDIIFSKPLILHLRNDLFGEPVIFGTLVVSASPPNSPAQTPMGTLQPGECISIPLQGYSGVFASCAVESTVYCSIKAA